jgi:hypothetical protein
MAWFWLVRSGLALMAARLRITCAGLCPFVTVYYIHETLLIIVVDFYSYV